MNSVITPSIVGVVPPHETWRLEQFSFAYVRAIAAAAGVSVVDNGGVDDDSIDLTLKRRTVGTPRRSPRLDLQIKATTDDCIRDDHIAFPLSIKNYDDLRDETVAAPRILVVVVVPPEVQDWTTHSEEQLILCRCAYWTSLRGLPEATSLYTRTVHLSRTAKLSVSEMDAMFVRLANGQAL